MHYVSLQKALYALAYLEVEAILTDFPRFPDGEFHFQRAHGIRFDRELEPDAITAEAFDRMSDVLFEHGLDALEWVRDRRPHWDETDQQHIMAAVNRLNETYTPERVWPHDTLTLYLPALGADGNPLEIASTPNATVVAHCGNLPIVHQHIYTGGTQALKDLLWDTFERLRIIPPKPPITMIRLRLPNPQNGGYGKTLPLAEIFVERGSQRRTFVYPHDGFYPTMIAQIEQAIAALRP